MLPSAAAGVVLWIASLTGAAAAQNASPSADAAFIEKYLGAGVLGAPVAAVPIANPSDYLAPGPTRMTFRLIGQPAGSAATEVEAFAPVDRPASSSSPAPTWALRTGNRVVSYLTKGADGSIGRLSQFDSEHAVISRFSPPEMVIPAGIAPGESVQRPIAVTVYDATVPDEVKYRGSLNQTLTYVGAYQVTVPAGTFDAVLIDMRFEGSVGPATIKDHVCVLFAKGIGRIAAVEQKSVSAFLFYNTDVKRGRVLEAVEASEASDPSRAH